MSQKLCHRRMRAAILPIAMDITPRSLAHLDSEMSCSVPARADLSRMGAFGLEPVVQRKSYQNMGWPAEPSFGLPATIEAA